MDVLKAIMTRRSIRKFTNQPISEGDLETILRAGMQAPSAHNTRPWHFIVLKDRAKREEVTKFHKYAQMAPYADLCLVVCGDSKKQEHEGFLVEDCSAAIQNMLLAIHGLGLGAVWCGIYPHTHLVEGLNRLCELPDNILPVGMIALGHKAEEKPAEDRFEPEKIHHEVW